MAGKLPAAVLALAGALRLHQASAHGKLTVPASRNELGGSSTCAHCLNGAGPCGDSSSLNFYAGPQATWTAGSIVPITVVVTAHHMGHYEFRVCDETLNGATSDPEGCLNKWVLERATPEEVSAAFGFGACARGDEGEDRPFCTPIDGNHPERWYLPPRGEVDGTHTVYFKVPAGLACDECTLQWHWWSANSCQPAGDYGCYKDVLQSNGYWTGSKAAWWTAFGGSCSGPEGPNGHFGCGEQFWNCADIAVLPADGSPSTAAPTSAPAPMPTSTPTAGPTWTPAPTSAPTLVPTSAPTAPQNPTPTPEPEPEPEPEPTAAPTSAPAGAGGTCTGAPCNHASQCRSQWGECGYGAAWCNDRSTWKAGGCGSPHSTAGGTCTGAPCAIASHCRSKWGSCGSGAPWCNDESTWKVDGCGPSLLAAKAVRLHRFLGA